MVEWLNDEVKHYRGTIICANASFDYRMSHHTGIYLPLSRMDDVIIRASCINEHLPAYDLDFLGKKYLGKRKETDIYHELAAMFGGPATRKSQMKNISLAPSYIVDPYACTDTDVTLELWEWQEKEIKRQGIERIIKFERDRMPTFIRAEMRGIRVDIDYAEEAAAKITPLIDDLQTKLNDEAGKEINVNSSPQVKSLFEPTQLEDGSWVASDGTPLESTPKGQASLGAEALRKLTDPKAAKILDIRSLIKTRDTFLKGHVIGHAVGDRVYPTINQSKMPEGGTETGRLSYQNPAMQQIPSRNKEVAAIVKPCFLPDKGQVWVDGDMASFEVRIFYHLIQNKKIIEAYAKDPNKDAHLFASDLTGLPRNAEYSGQPNAKQLNLSMIFNSGDGAIADKMGMEWWWEEFIVKRGKDAGKKVRYKKAGAEAEKVIAQYHRQVPGVRELAQGCKDTAEKRGYIFTYTGRRLRFPSGAHSYAASGKLIQATAADRNKENWSIIEEILGNDGHLILNTHDSYSMSLPEDWKPYYDKVKKEVENAPFDIPLVLDFSGVGKNWWEAVKEG
jgi:DNA polymerase I-like protein with 3'-5' exonuclease and polymerase domains